MRIQVLKDEDETVYQGYYHNQWDTQMGEESFGDNALFFCLFFFLFVSHMSLLLPRVEVRRIEQIRESRLSSGSKVPRKR